MTSIAEGDPFGLDSGLAASIYIAAGILVLVGAAVGLGIGLLMLVAPDMLAMFAIPATADMVTVGVFGAAAVIMLVAGIVTLFRPGTGGGLALTGSLLWLAAMLLAKNYGYVIAIPFVLGFVGGLAALVINDRRARHIEPRLIYRQSIFTRVTHWVWAIAMFFLLLSGLQIFNAHPSLYIGQESGFAYDNSVLRIYPVNEDGGGTGGRTTILGQTFNTTGVLGKSGPESRPAFRGFPAWATIPSSQDLATGRVVHFFFAWILGGALAIWAIASLANGHIWRDVILKPRDIRELPRDIVDHIVLRFNHGRSYSPLQKVAYFSVFFILFPLIILTGLTMSPTMDAAWPWLLDVFGGRQTARTIHFIVMVLLVLFFVVHIIMVVLAGPINELRSMITGYYRTSPGAEPGNKDQANG